MYISPTLPLSLSLSLSHLPSVGVVLLLVGGQQPSEAEVSDLEVLGGLHQDVACGQVAMHQVALLKVTHPLEDTVHWTSHTHWTQGGLDCIVHKLYIYTYTYMYIRIYLLHVSSQCCGTLRSLAWAFPTSAGELFFQ